MFQLFYCLILLALVSSTSSLGEKDSTSIAAYKISVTAISRKENINSTLIESQSRSSSFNPNLRTFKSAVEIIMSRGYHVERHPITTDDDYIIMLHRIPYPKGQTSGPTGRPIFIFPGLMGGTEGFVMAQTENALLLMLADLGYDVWVMNNRGTISSRGHVNLDPYHNRTYWKFSYDEMGRYDCPAGINYILNITGRENVTLITYSLGTMVFFTCVHYHPELNDRVDQMIALAPYTKSILIRLVLAFLNPLMFSLWPFVDRVFSSKNHSPPSFLQKLCLKNPTLTLFCNNGLFLLIGADYGNMNQNMRIAVLNHLLTNSVPVRTLIHQIFRNVAVDGNFRPKFNKFNYGWIGNWKRYGMIKPPAYDLSKVTTPIHIFHGKNDYFANLKYVERLASRLPNVKETYLVDSPRFQHLDFLFHRNVKELVYNKLIAILPPP